MTSEQLDAAREARTLLWSHDRGYVYKVRITGAVAPVVYMETEDGYPHCADPSDLHATEVDALNACVGWLAERLSLIRWRKGKVLEQIREAGRKNRTSRAKRTATAGALA